MVWFKRIGLNTMTKDDLKTQMVSLGFDSKKVDGIIDAYNEVPSFTYMSVYNPKGITPKPDCDYVTAFQDAHSKYGLYIFYDNNDQIIYIGEAAEEPFKDRLSQHFNESDGGLRNKLASKSELLSKLEASNVLSLYGKNDKTNSRETHFDEDLLIGLFRPDLNDR